MKAAINTDILKDAQWMTRIRDIPDHIEDFTILVDKADAKDFRRTVSKLIEFIGACKDLHCKIEEIRFPWFSESGASIEIKGQVKSFRCRGKYSVIDSDDSEITLDAEYSEHDLQFLIEVMRFVKE